MHEINVENNIRLGYGVLDMQVGDWVASDDVATFTHVRHPEQDNKLHVRELLAILGKRFANVEADEIWQEIENYRKSLAITFGPPDTNNQLIDFAKAAKIWYTNWGSQFEKNWYLTSRFDLNFARTNGHEHIGRRWLRWLHPDFGFFIQTGFSSWQLLAAVHSKQFHGWFKTLDLLRREEPAEIAVFWVRLTAYLVGFNLSIGQVKQVVNEVAEHALRLKAQHNRAVGTAEATLNYFRRLELAGLDSQVIAEAI